MEAFFGQICAFPFGFNPPGWLPCDGRLVSLSQNTALFSLLGTAFGGDGKSTFGLPNLSGNMAVGATDLGGSTNGLSNIDLGETGGNSQVTLNMLNLPPHSHGVPANSSGGSSAAPAGAAAALLTDSLGLSVAAYGAPGGVPMDPQAIGAAGSPGPQPVQVQNPSLGILFCICTDGVYPSRP
jgi:microcystin-dependent protein